MAIALSIMKNPMHALCDTSAINQGVGAQTKEHLAQNGGGIG